MAITDVRTKINSILSEGVKKPKDPHQKSRRGAPEATAAEACCESEVFEEVTDAQGLTPAANMVLGILRQKLEQGQFQVLSQDVIEQLKAAKPDQEGEIEQGFEQLKAKGLISVSDGGISMGGMPDEHVLRDCTVEDVEREADRIIREFSFMRRGNKSLEDQGVYHGVSGRAGTALVDQGGDEVAVRFDDGKVEWMPKTGLEVGLKTATYIAPIDHMQMLINKLTAPGSKFANPLSGWHWSISQYGNANIAQCEVKAPASFHKELSTMFVSKDQLKGMRETVELTVAGVQLAVESLSFVKK